MRKLISQFSQLPFMATGMERPRLTEIKVRMDCNGCVQKIRKALQGIDGVDEIQVDFSQQKITISGSADPGSIGKAIKKTRKTAVICLHPESSDQKARPTDPMTDAGAPLSNTKNPPAEPTEPPTEPTKADHPPPPETASSASGQSAGAEGIHVVHHPLPEHGYQYAVNPNMQQRFRAETFQPIYMAHGYNTYRPSPYVTEYANPGSALPVYAAHGYTNGTYRPPEYPYPGAAQPVYATPGYNAYRRPPEYANFGSVHHVHATPGYNSHRPPATVTEQANTGSSQTVYATSGYKSYSSQPSEHANSGAPQPVYATTGYNSYRPQPSVTEQAKAGSAHPMFSTHRWPCPTEYEYLRPAPPTFSYHGRQEYYNEDSYNNRSNGNITSIFSDENPNSCRIT